MHSTIAVDLAKSVFEVAVSHQPGVVAERHRLSRARFVEFFADRQPATVLMEACGSAHHWARTLQSLGHHPVLLPPHAVKPYVHRNKTDRADAKGLLEASRNREVHPVPVTSLDQQALGALHRLRSTWIAARTSRINTLRGVLRELGCVIPVGARHVIRSVDLFLKDADSGVPGALRPAVAGAIEEIRALEGRIKDVERQIEELGKDCAVVGRLRSIPGIGTLTASALFAFVARCVGSPRAARFQAISGSHRGSRPRVSSAGWDPSPSAPTCT